MPGGVTGKAREGIPMSIFNGEKEAVSVILTALVLENALLFVNFIRNIMLLETCLRVSHINISRN